MKFLIVIIIFIGGLLFLYVNTKIKFKANFTIHNANIFLKIFILKKNFTIVRKIDYIVVVKKFLYRFFYGENSRRNYSNLLKGYRYFKKIFTIDNLLFYEEDFNNNNSITVEFDIVNKFKEKRITTYP